MEPNLPPDGNNIPEIPPEMQGVFEWFNSNVQRLEGAYNELGRKFAAVNQELEATNRKLDALLGSMRPGVLMVDPELNISVLNHSAEQMLGVYAEECLGRPLSEVFLPETGVGQCLLRSLEEGRDQVSEERTIIVGDRTVPAAFTASRVRDQEGRLLGAVETFTDISELKDMEQEMAQDRVLRALGEMAATVAHEIRNPLGGIGGYAGLLAREIPADDSRKRLVDKIIQGVSSLNKIVSNLLFYTRKTNLQLVRLDLRQWMKEIISHVEVEVESREETLTISRNFPERECWVEIDPERFQQVAMNLLQNAVQALGGQGEIVVSIHLDDFLVLSVRDNGPGIPLDVQEQIFTPFYTTKENGTGLGLAIVRKMVELHRGRMKLISDAGEGTEFQIFLPRAD